MVGLVWFVGFSFKTKTEPDLLEFMVLKIGLISFSSRFGFFGYFFFVFSVFSVDRFFLTPLYNISTNELALKFPMKGGMTIVRINQLASRKYAFLSL